MASEWVSLRSRPIHVTTDIPGAHLLVAYNNPSGVTVHQIQADGTVGSEVKPPTMLDAGIYAIRCGWIHRIRA